MKGFLIDLFASKVCIRFTFFFFSSRRRHTRCSRDWSSDVCSSDLQPTVVELGAWCIILLNSAQPQRIDGKITEAQLQYLTEQLTRLSDRHVIIACQDRKSVV